MDYWRPPASFFRIPSSRSWLLLLLPLLYSISSFSQDNKLRANHWYFGNKYGLDFSSGKPVLDTQSAMRTYESCCTMSDTKGELLYYTDGGGREDGSHHGYIWNSKHEPMEGGDLGSQLGGGYSAAQGCITFKKPGPGDTYCLFTVDEFETIGIPQSTLPQGKGCNYFEIDMAANNGLGKVTLSNVNLLSPSFEYISATRHANCEDYWVVVLTGNHAIEGNPDAADSFYVFQVTENGILPPLKTPLPAGQSGLDDEYGLIKISPDGSRLLCGAYLYEFDNATGAISAAYNLNANLLAALDDPLAFSPNSRFLYRFRIQSWDSTATMHVQQYDLDANDLATSSILLDQVEFHQVVVFGTPQLGPDGRLYIPVQPDAYNSPTFVSVIHHPNVRGIGAQFEVNSFAITHGQKDERFLRFGNFTDHIFAYEPVLPVDLGPDLILGCQDNLSQVLYAPLGMEGYLWSNGSTEDHLSISEGGVYWVEIFDNCEMGADTIEVRFEDETLTLDLGPDTLLCEGETLLLSSSIANATYQWSDSSTASSFLATSAGTYSLQVQLGHCEWGDSIELDMLALPQVNLGLDTTICEGEPLLLDVELEDLATYEWQDGSSQAIFEVSESGSYSVLVTNECGEATAEVEVMIVDCQQKVCQLYIPNAFTPNDDGGNDTYRVFGNCVVDNFVLRIFDRWGEQVFESRRLEDSWDGNFHGRHSPNGVYAYLIQYNSPSGPQQISGDLTLLR